MKAERAFFLPWILALSFAFPANGQSATVPDPTQDRPMMSAGFLTGHPDLRYRLLGLERYKQGDFEESQRFFRRAAFYADKPSQAMVAEMLWDGKGSPLDRPQAYAWMDLAAERGYEGFLELRERYWSALSAAERATAIQSGPAIFSQYADEAALPRIAAVLRRERRNVTGSRAGFTGNLRIVVPGPVGDQQIDGSKFYDERYWDPKQYLAWHDAIWAKPRVARVDIGGVESMSSSSQPTRIPTVAPQPDAPEPQTDDAMPKLQDHDNKQ